MIGLTAQQRALLTFIERYQRDHDGVAPSFDEMKEAIGLASKSGIHRLLTALEERGFIRRIKNRARALEVHSDITGARAIAHALRLASIDEIRAEYRRRLGLTP